jgi:hypothetical protein
MRRTYLKRGKSVLKKSKLSKGKKGISAKKRHVGKKSKSPLRKEISLCDMVFSQYIRLSNADTKGIVKCFTCRFKAFWKQSGIECGHFKSRTHMGTRWYKKNNEPQCISCNQYRAGNLKIFERNLIKKYGEGIIEHLEQESIKKVKLTISKIRNLRNHFESEVVRLKKELGLK